MSLGPTSRRKTRGDGQKSSFLNCSQMIDDSWALGFDYGCQLFVLCIKLFVCTCRCVCRGGLRLRLTVKVPSMDIILLRLVSTSNGTPYWRSGIKAAWSLVACLWKQVRFKDHTDPSSYSSDMCCNLVSPPPLPPTTPTPTPPSVPKFNSAPTLPNPDSPPQGGDRDCHDHLGEAGDCGPQKQGPP